MSSCQASYTLLGFLLQKNDSLCALNAQFLRDYADRLVNALLWVSLITVTTLLLRRVFRLLRFWSKGRRIPGPPCPSFYGHSRFFSRTGSTGNLNEFLSRSHKEYGPIVRLWLGPTQLLVSVKDPELIKEMLLKAEDKLPLTGKAFRLAFGPSNLFVSSFEKVQKRRESLSTELNGSLLERVHDVSLKVANGIAERIDSAKFKGALDCGSVSQHMAFSIIGSAFFGDAFLVWSNAKVYEELLMMVAKDACFWASYKIPPLWKRSFWRYQQLCAQLKSLTRDIVQESRQHHKLSGSFNQYHRNETTTSGCMADSNAEVLFAKDTVASILFPGELNDCIDLSEESCGNIMGMMFHGCFTAAGLIGSILTRLVMHPEIQEKIYSEICSVCKKSSMPDVIEVQKMHYLFATVYESARLLPAGPLLQRCSLKHDLNLCANIIIPAGAILAVPTLLVQTDGSSWGIDASQFNPTRFLSKATNCSDHNDVKPNFRLTTSIEGSGAYGSPLTKCLGFEDPNANAAFLPFGSGVRACIGQKFAVTGITALLASLLQLYEVRLDPVSKKDPNPTMSDSVLQLPPSPSIVLVKRDC
ncbi:hypothetical protein AMTRI_Chr01g103380 [Amborella trichopoda]|uniref:Cytochrome P450 n=1 Tax=Amborella trichopoda TaxID=13333 RepID=W1NUT8_AMBTC|nr:cytochrome P450 734A5 isoform X2 [Amborella trichopoda]ERM99078.1 hypothetical protein AMTR_s00101p00105330 [Amborella trichopoda]|eukprot:XP_006836225.1 cytochrome P450 734A5 isoform X2 [Amborella trichopoda]